MISLDTLRARNVGAYGHTRDTTPFLDQLAAAGVLFENAITAAVTTGPAHMSLFTGLYPVHHGMRSGREPRRASGDSTRCVAAPAGYHTAAFTEDGYIIRDLGFGDGFSEYNENTGRAGIGSGGRARHLRARAAWLRAQPAPALPALRAHLPGARALRASAGDGALFRDDGAAGTASEELRKYEDHYDREIRFVDEQLRLLVDALDLHGLRDRHRRGALGPRRGVR